MKKMKFLPVIALLLFSCGNPTEEKKAEVTPAPAEAPAATVTFPYNAAYSSDWKMGDAGNAKVVLDIYKAIENNNIDELDKYLADTVTSVSYDNVMSRSPKEKIIKNVKSFRSNFDSVAEEFLAFVPLHSNDKNEDWVATWMTERVKRKDGSKDSTTYQETWRFRDGKIYYRGTFARYAPGK